MLMSDQSDMASRITVAERKPERTFYHGRKFVNDFFRVGFHVVLHPVNQKPHKSVIVKMRDELFVFFAHAHALRFFFDDCI